MRHLEALREAGLKPQPPTKPLLVISQGTNIKAGRGRGGVNVFSPEKVLQQRVTTQRMVMWMGRQKLRAVVV